MFERKNLSKIPKPQKYSKDVFWMMKKLTKTKIQSDRNSQNDSPGDIENIYRVFSIYFVPLHSCLVLWTKAK